MTDRANMVTWGMVRPKIDADVAKLHDELATAPLDRVQMLQARIAALGEVRGWFERCARDETVFSQAGYGG